MATNDLTPGERRAFKAYLDEEIHEAAAKSLGISTQTLKNHLGSAYRKIGARKAHSAIYRMSLSQGHDPLAVDEAELSLRKDSRQNGADSLESSTDEATE